LTDRPLSHLDALAASMRRLRGIVEPLDDTAIAQPAYPRVWTIAQVMSHLGSGAVIMQRSFEAAVAGAAVPDEFAPSVWEEWNAKSPRAQVDDALAADAGLVAALEAFSDEESERFFFSTGPINVGFEGFVGLRLNEHALHTWDIEVVLDQAATIPSSMAELVVDNLELIARYTGKPTPGEPRLVTVRTTDPRRRFIVDLTAEGATLTPSEGSTGEVDLALPAEAFVRLIYGRFDPAHTPPIPRDSALLDRLRTTYPGP
jgi:uncharacterized protein (TIGR03083 family)